MDDFNVHRRMLGGKIDPLNEIRNAGIVTNGSVFWVKQITDADYVTLKSTVGQQNMFGTIQSAIDKAANDRNDYVLVTSPADNTAYDLGTSLDINKDRLHLFAVGYNANPNAYGVTLRGFGTGSGTPVDSQLVEVTGDGAEFAGFRVLGTMGTSAGGTVTNGLLRVNAHDFYSHDASYEWNIGTLLAVSAVTTPGTKHSARFDNCWFGNAADMTEGAHAGVVSLGAGGKRWSFNDSTFVLSGGSTADRFVTTGTGAKEFTAFRRCDFVNVGTDTPASAFVGSVTVNNPVYVINSSAVKVTQMGTDPTVYVAPAASGTRALVYNPGIAVGTAALVAA